MSLFQKIKEKFNSPQVTTVTKTEPLMATPEAITHQFMNFEDSYRIGLLGHLENYESQEPIKQYKQLIEKNGYECEVLMFINSKEPIPNKYLPSFDLNDLDKQGIPYSPQTDRFILRRFDMLINLYFTNEKPLLYISHMSHAKCRVGAFIDTMHSCTDIMISCRNEVTISTLIKEINETLKLKPYVRKNL